MLFRIVLFVALVLRIGACWYWADDLTRDRDAYLGIARNITAGNGFCSPDTTSPTAYRPPVYPLLLGAARGIFPEALAVAVINIAAGLATVWAVCVLVQLWWQPPQWILVTAGLAIALDPLLLRYTAQPMTECLFTALTAWTVVGVTRLWLDPFTLRRGAWATGFVAGTAALCRPTLYPYLGLVWLCLLFCAYRFNLEQFSGRQRQVGHYSLAVMLVVSLWASRNLLVMHDLLLTTTHGGYTLLLGNNPVFYGEVARQPWGTVWEHDSLTRWQASLADDLLKERGERVDEITADRWHADRAWKTIHADPTGFRAAVWYRVRSFWSLAPRGPEVTQNRLTAFIAVWYAVLFITTAVGFVIALRQRRPAVMIGGLLIATVATLHLLYWTDTRMRAPLHPVFIAFAAAMGERRAVRPNLSATPEDTSD